MEQAYSVRVWHELGKLRQEVQSGAHRLTADEPVALGGEDNGPAPLDFLCIGLGACTAITLQMYAARKNWDTTGLEVRVGMEKAGEVTRFHRTILLPDKLDGEQKKRLLEIADHCPVHRTLMGKIEISTERGS